MKVFWREWRRGQRLVVVLSDEDAHEDEVGGVRETREGFDAFAKTFGYEPGRAQKGIPTMEEAKAFVENFRPWELYDDTQGITVDPEVRPVLN